MGKTTKAVLVVLFLAGAVAALGKAFIWGESVTNYGSYTPWGLWVGLYILLVGASAGAAWTGIYTAHVNGGNPNRLTTISLVVAGACLLFALGFIGIDLGKPMKGFFIFLSPTFSSKLAWASWLYLAFFGCLAGYLFTKAQKVFLYLSGIIALGFLLAEGMFFGGMTARIAWNSWLTPLSFITSAIATGCAAVFAVGLLSQREVVEEEGYSLKKVLFYAIIANAVVEGIHLAMGIGGGAEKSAATSALFSSIPFWGYVVLGIAAPLFMLKKAERTCICSAATAFIGLAFYKYAFVKSGFGSEPLPGLSSAFQTSRFAVSYNPSIIEWIVALGFIAGAILAADFIIGRLFATKQA